MKARKFSTILLIALMIVSAVGAFAVPQMPHKFYGDVTVGGVDAIDGTIVHAEIDGVTYVTTTTLDGQYVIQVPGDDPSTTDVVEGGDLGDTIEFYVDDELATSDSFLSGSITNLDLAVAGGAPPANVDPVADADGPYTGETGVAISFDGTGSSDSDGTIVSYSWNFGDGGTGTGASPTHAHTYTAADIYTVTLTVTDDDGDTHIDSTTATVTDPVIPDDDEDEHREWLQIIGNSVESYVIDIGR